MSVTTRAIQVSDPRSSVIGCKRRNFRGREPEEEVTGSCACIRVTHEVGVLNLLALSKGDRVTVLSECVDRLVASRRLS